MNPGGPVDEATWRNRFIIINITRIAGTIVVLFGLFVWQTDFIREGGSVLGFPIALFGLAASFGGPLMLARRWRTPPGE
ncbi:hypothetical protein [Sphingosinicella rhizophila]|uniref:Uncharacterized protein n=1 Tax=Sphingosinicella rhizophila TaxID=3050082 RepID=A0ABU3Q753_9SPHN|nr:hypothetical protein [Sphingosinicella sp. GR2756]MDT9599229.1 hypothetical protein [Sphingosinicella sp. GR2756]